MGLCGSTLVDASNRQARGGGCGRWCREQIRPSTAGLSDWGRTRPNQTREAVERTGGRGSYSAAAPEYPRPNPRGLGGGRNLLRSLIGPPHHNTPLPPPHTPLATVGRDHRASGPIDQSSCSVSLVTVLAFPTKEARYPRVPGDVRPSHTQRLSQTPGNPLPGGGEDYWENAAWELRDKP